MKNIAGLALVFASSLVSAGTAGTPVPEPGIWGLLGVAGVALVVARFFNKKK